MGSFLRFIAHFISGVVWFGIYAPEGWNIILWSVVYNASYMIPVFYYLQLLLFYYQIQLQSCYIVNKNEMIHIVAGGPSFCLLF
ncbi:energy-coupled thiamine transporter ThiT [Anaerobacillus sp. HL2]|nr:energy-coupled thiamine transporter ThiT [Anaerobacillus sp. HL2]